MSKIISPRNRENDILRAGELQAFMTRHGISQRELSEILGVTENAIRAWLVGDRGISIPLSRLIRLFDKRPQLLREF